MAQGLVDEHTEEDGSTSSRIAARVRRSMKSFAILRATGAQSRKIGQLGKE